jgi:parallel beta-helix repeat protein
MKVHIIVKKTIVVGMLLLFVGASVFPSVISVNNAVVTPLQSFATIQVDDDGDGDYTSISDAIAHANTDDVIEVYSGTYTEHVVVPLRVTLQGIAEELGGGGGSGKPVVDGSGSGNVIEITADGVIITGFEVMNSGTDGNVKAGIYTRYYSDIEVGTCNIHDNLNGILFRDESDGHNIHDNTILNNAKNGIWVKGSIGSTISNNIIRFSGENGIRLGTATDGMISDNVESNAVVNGLYVIDSTGTTVQRNSFLNNTKGGRLENSGDSIFKINTFQGNSQHGLYLWSDSSDNLFYLNNFVENGINAYDPGPQLNNQWNGLYPTGGNYWDDYTGVDLYSGPNQNQPDPDGIGDTPYEFDQLVEDLYPQMYMEDPNPPVVDIVTPQKGYLYISGNIIMPLFLTTMVIRDINVTADAVDIISGVQRVEFYLDGTLVQNDTSAPYTWMWDTWSLKKRHTLSAVAYDLAGNSNSTEFKVWKFL